MFEEYKVIIKTISELHAKKKEMEKNIEAFVIDKINSGVLKNTIWEYNKTKLICNAIPNDLNIPCKIPFQLENKNTIIFEVSEGYNGKYMSITFYNDESLSIIKDKFEININVSNNYIFELQSQVDLLKKIRS